MMAMEEAQEEWEGLEERGLMAVAATAEGRHAKYLPS